MSSFLGVLKTGDTEINIDHFVAAMSELGYWKPDFSNTWNDEMIAVGNHILYTTRESLNERLPYFDKESGLCIIADCRIDYRQELIKKLGLSGLDSEIYPDSRLILDSYKLWDKDCVKHLYGDYSFCIWDTKLKELFCARDHFGCRPFYYLKNDSFLVIASVPWILSSVVDGKLLIDDLFIADSLSGIIPKKNQTAFKGILRLEPAHSMVYSQGKLIIRKYWDLNVVHKFTSLTQIEASEGLKSRFIESVQNRIRSMYAIGSELSGGLDSTLVVCIANKLAKKESKELYTFTHGFSREQQSSNYLGFDEQEYSELVNRFCNISNSLSINGEEGPGAYSALQKYISNTIQPVNHLYSLMSDLLYTEVQNRGIRTLLSGYGGDEGITFSASSILHELFCTGRWIKFVEQTWKLSNSDIKLFLYKLVFVGLEVLAPWIISFLKKWGIIYDFRRKRFDAFSVNPRVAHSFNTRHRYFKDNQNFKSHSVRIQQYNRINQKYVSQRFEDSYLVAQSYRIEYSYPFWDVKLLEFYYSLPSHLKNWDGIDRRLFRIAFDGIIPDQVRRRNNKAGTMIPNIFYRFSIDEEKFRRIINDGKENNEYHYVDYDKMDKMIEALLERNKGKSINFGIRAFYCAMSVLILQKWQREGKIDIGIKC